MSRTSYPDLLGQENDTGPAIRRLVERRDTASRDALVHRVLAEFHEMPCLRLTPAQAQRLFGLRSDVSARLIGDLVRIGRLRLDEDGRYAVSVVQCR
jgi:hypothetical protein